ncbi:MAG: alpha/beta fold hydrolase [Pseudomonadota bacterium]
MTVFVLVHGAWHGGWCWAALERELQAIGHQSFAPTLMGLGEKSHMLRADITPDDHVLDIVNFIKWRELKDVVLVGHSYGGTVITGVAGQIPSQISGMVYLDAFVPEESGVSLFGRANPNRMAKFQEQIDAGAIAIEPDLFDAWTDDPKVKDWLHQQCTPHPVGCFQNGVTLTGRETEIAHKFYILAARNKPSAFGAEYEKVDGRADWKATKIQTKHNAMIEDPRGLATILNRYVSERGL